MAKFKTPLRMNEADVPLHRAVPPSQDSKPSPVAVKMVYGTDSGLMLARREKGYHSRPHWHDSEQFNYVLEGEIWFFVDNDGFRCVKGDFVRIPRNAVHWTWVRAEAGCLMIESHTPSLTGDPELRPGAIALVRSDETPDPKGVDNIFIDYPQAGEIERRALEIDSD